MQNSNETTEEIEVDPAIVPVDLFAPLALLGQGALGFVYLCIDKRLGKKVAVKCLSSITDDHVVSFQNEARIASKLNHRSVIRILDFGVAGGGRPYMVMEFFDGRSLQDVLDRSITLNGSSSNRQHCLAEYEALELFLEVCDALEYLHRNGVFHRDLKPSNILVRRNENGNADVRLIDFNLSKTTQNVQSRTVVQGQTVVGTPQYMSPDQIAGSTYDARSEVYSLGCVMYETLTGVPVFEGVTALEILNKHAMETLIPPQEHFPDLSEMTAAIIEKCLSKDRQNRYQTIGELKEQLQQSMRKLTESPTENREVRNIIDRRQVFDGVISTPGKIGSQTRRRHRPVVVAIAGIIAIGSVFAVTRHSFLRNDSIDDEHQERKKKHKVQLMSPLVSAFAGEMTDAVSTAKIKINKGETDITVPLTPTDEDLKFFADKHNVARLSLPESSVTDAGLLHLVGMKNLRVLALDRTDVRTLETMSKLKGLHDLSLRFTRIDDDSLLNLKGMELHQLRLVNTPITDKGIANLVGLPLQDLDLAYTKVTDKCIPSLLTFKDMHSINLQHTVISLNGVKRIIQGLPSLAGLDVKDSTVTVHQQADLMREYPTIKFRDDTACVFEGKSQIAHDLWKQDRIAEALPRFRECENMLKKRYGEDFSKTQNYTTLRKSCERILRERAGNTKQNSAAHSKTSGPK